jgi:GntR family transcriptional regulator/MocR family aminotransferase
MKKVASTVSPIVAVDRDGALTMQAQIYHAYRRAIVEGVLRAGQRVPSTRVLAAKLGVSRMPVMSAYAQLLAEGYFESRVGSGTVVSRALPGRAPAHSHAAAGAGREPGPRRPVSRRGLALPSAESFYRNRGLGPFALSQIAFEHFPLAAWKSLVIRHLRQLHAGALDYGDPMGLRELREAIALHLRTARGVRCEASQVMIVSGSQQGLEVAARVLLDPGDTVWMEDPGYRFARSVFGGSGCTIVPVPVDAEGLDVRAGAQGGAGARAVLVTPSHQYPLGVTLSASRRLQLLDWAEASGAWILEDDFDSEFRYEGAPVTSLQGLDRNARVVYIGTFSKILFPSLRLGYIVIPPDLVERFLAARFAFDLGPPTLSQAVLADFLAEGHFARHIRRMRQVYAERRAALIAALRRRLGASVGIVGDQAGIHLAVLVPGCRDRDVYARAARERQWFVPLSVFYLGDAPRQGFVLGFGSAPLAQIAAGVDRLAELLREAV